MRSEQFLGENYNYIWSDHWCLDGENAWFMAGTIDMLFCVEMNTKRTLFVNEILSDKECMQREHTICLKKGNCIVCLPYNGKNIWCYDLIKHSWWDIPLLLPDGVRAACYNAWFVKDRLYVISLGLRQIIEVDIENGQIKGYYNWSADPESHLSRSVLVEHFIYTAVSDPDSLCIYKFDCLEKRTYIYRVSKINEQIQTLCFDGSKFWMSGPENIYIWSEKTEKLSVLNDFPADFGIWNFLGKYKKIIDYERLNTGVPLFIDGISVGRYVWFIPFRTNQILYADRETLEIRKFHVAEEEHTEKDIGRQLLGHKYLLEYVRDDRYIGIFSLKNTWVFEIDSETLSYKILDYYIDDKTKQKVEGSILGKIINGHNIFFEKEKTDLSHWITEVKKYRKKFSKKMDKQIGEELYIQLI